MIILQIVMNIILMLKYNQLETKKQFLIEIMILKIDINNIIRQEQKATIANETLISLLCISKSIFH